MIAYVFPGQASQFAGMGADLYSEAPKAKEMFDRANEILGYKITEIMFGDDEKALQETIVTQPAVFLHSVITFHLKAKENPEAVAGHSLGEYSALVANEALSFEDALRLVVSRAKAMQKCCEGQEGTMAAIIGLDDEKVVDICQKTPGTVIAANFNCPGQLVISGKIQSVQSASKQMLEAGAMKAIPLAVGGAFHSPLMEDALIELKKAIEQTPFNQPICPVYQNATAKAVSDPEEIQVNLIKQLTAPVLWTQTIQQMLADGIDHFVECGGTGKVLRGMIRRIDRNVTTDSL